MKERISLQEARARVISAQGLRGSVFGNGKAGALKAIEHLGYVQIDTISVVERAHHHVFWSRAQDYRPAILDELLSQDRKIYEYWNHAVSYLPMRDYRYSIPMMKAISSGEMGWFKPRPTRVIKRVLDRIRAEGALRAQDFDAPPGHRSGVWFDAKPAKRALEQLLYEGELMISGRRGFQKLYDLTERVLPPEVETSVPTDDELARFVIRRALRSQGLATPEEIHYLLRHHRAGVMRVLPEMLEARELVELEVEGQKKGDGTYFRLAEGSPLGVARELAADLTEVSILSPFDNLVIQRKRLKRLFGFDYQIECYVPAPKRKHGYFSLPLLWGDRFVGRLDAKADRKERRLVVRSLHFEKGAFAQNQGSRAEFESAFEKSLARFAEFNGCEK